MDQISPCILILNFPAGAFCGIDLLSFTTSPKFQGIKDVPKGWHFVFTSPTDSFSLRHGCWVWVNELALTDEHPDLIVLKWNASSEELEAEESSKALDAYRSNLAPIWKEGLMPYRQRAPKKDEDGNDDDDFVIEGEEWSKLTDCLSARLLSRITRTKRGSNVKMFSLTSASSASRDFDRIPGLSKEDTQPYEGDELDLLPIELRQTWRTGAVGRERTDAARDRSWALEQLIDEHCTEPTEVVGEMQFTFLMVLTLNNFSCMEQWKRLLQLLLTCSSAAARRSQLFVRFLSTLHLQLERSEDAEGGLFDMSDENGNLLRRLLKLFHDGLDQQSGQGKADVVDELDDLEDYLRDEHGWNFGEDIVQRGMIDLEDGERIEMDLNGADVEDEYEPTVVELTPEQARFLADAEAPRRDDQEFNGSGRSHRTGPDDDEEDDRDLDDMDTRF